MIPSDFEAAADAIADARRAARPLASLPTQWIPHGLADTVRLQRAVAARIGAVRGWKVGALTATQQAAMEVDASVSAPLLEPWFQSSPAIWPRSAFIAPLLECEFAFELGADLPPRAAGYSRADVEASIAALRIVIEVVDRRIPRDLPVAVELVDALSNGAFVVGPAHTDWRAVDYPNHGVVVRDVTPGRGSELARGTGRAVLDGDPVGAVVMLANAQPDLPPGLRRGDVVTTGSCALASVGTGGGDYEADFGTLGRVLLRLT